MTLVLSLVTPDFAIQVSDRRLTALGGPSPGAVVEDEQNKAVVVCNRLAFGYSGLTQIAGQSTDDWLLEIAAQQPPLFNAQRLLQRVCEEATDAFSGIAAPPKHKRHAFVAVGWACPDGAAMTPFISRVSNALDEYGNWLEKAADRFAIQTVFLRVVEPFGLEATGARLPADSRARIQRSIAECVSRGVGVGAYVRVLVKAIQDIHAVNPLGTVGRSLIAVSLPLAATEREPALVAPTQPLFTGQHVETVYVPSDVDTGVRFHPHYTCGGTQFSRTWSAVSFDPPALGPEEPPWLRGPVILSARTLAADRSVVPSLALDYQLAGWGLIAEADPDHSEPDERPGPCLLKVGPDSPLALIQRDTRYLVVADGRTAALEPSFSLRFALKVWFEGHAPSVLEEVRAVVDEETSRGALVYGLRAAFRRANAARRSR